MRSQLTGSLKTKNNMTSPTLELRRSASDLSCEWEKNLYLCLMTSRAFGRWQVKQELVEDLSSKRS
jgi:hypothetical protein